MPRADIVLEIDFQITPHSAIVRTNAKQDAVRELLGEWLRGQIGKGRDEREPNRRGVYHIRIELDLSDDTFYTQSDTGNESLTCGLVRDVFSRLDSIEIQDLS